MQLRDVIHYLPAKVNQGRLITAYTLTELHRRMACETVVLPVCSLGTPLAELTNLGPLVLPPLYHEALDPSLKESLLARVRECFPYYLGTRRRLAVGARLKIIELPRRAPPRERPPRVLVFSVDTAVEEHGPHLPLATDTIQSYGVLERLSHDFPEVTMGPPVEYGQLTWGLPFGLSIDITAPLLTRYVTAFVNALLDWVSPAAMYVVDVHGSAAHRAAIQEGLAASRCSRWSFRWLHEPLAEFASQRGDLHAGGVETALVQRVRPELVDATWWPGRLDEIAVGQLSPRAATELSADMGRLIQHVESHPLNGIVGNIRNYSEVDAHVMLDRMLAVARDDVKRLLS